MPLLLLRTVRNDGTPLSEDAARTGFKWPVGPDAVGQTVTAPDWDPNKECGGGLHGLLWGQGDFLLLNQVDDNLEWQVVEVAPGSPVVDLGGKVKTQSVIIRFSGPDPIEACAFLKAHTPKGIVSSFDAVGDGGCAEAGDRGYVSVGVGGKGKVGRNGVLTFTDSKGDMHNSTTGFRPNVYYKWDEGQKKPVAVEEANFFLRVWRTITVR